MSTTTAAATETATPAGDRCLRCGTKMRNNRLVCPCCGLEVAQAGQPSAAEQDPRPSKTIKKVAAKAGVKICGMCLATVPEQEIVDHEGQKVCPACAENLRKKTFKRPPTGP
ncbi:MAG: hypothetical protein ABSE73_27010 [Planctomycetota bacterium]